MSAAERETSSRSMLLELPDELLAKVFTQLDRVTLTRCYRVCKHLNSLLTSNSTIALHHTLMCNSLILNPNALRPSPVSASGPLSTSTSVLETGPSSGTGTGQGYIPPSSAQLLATLRERITRFRNFKPRSRTAFDLVEPEGRLYEYLEGHLLRSTAGRALSGNIAFYDLNKLNDWEDVSESGSNGGKGRGRLQDSNVVQEPSQQVLGSQSQQGGSIIQPELDQDEEIGSEDSSDEEMEVEVMEVLGSDVEIDTDDSDAFVDFDDDSEESEGEESEGSEEMDGEAVDLGDIDNSVGESIRRMKKFDFEIAEFAVDPGQDLLVLVELKRGSGPPAIRRTTMHIHLMSLTTFDPHPKARQPVLDWPYPMSRSSVNLTFQICDDGLFVLSMNQRAETTGQICGWQWTTGWNAIRLRALGTMSFETFILLSPSSFAIPTITTHLDVSSDTLGELHNPTDLSFTYHIHMYAFPPFASTVLPDEKSSEPLPPPHTPIHVATVDLPRFAYDLAGGIPPPRMDIRTDPPPRATFPQYVDGHVPPFAPDPKSGIIVMNIYCQSDTFDETHFVMILLKSTLLKYLPSPDSPLLRQAFTRPAPVIPWSTVSPHVRMFGPRVRRPSWVCNVYHNRYAAVIETGRGRHKVRLMDFDPLRVNKEIKDRHHQQGGESAAPADEGGNSTDVTDRDGVQLVTKEENFVRDTDGLDDTFTVGSQLPYMYVDAPCAGDIALLDAERVVTIGTQRLAPGRYRTTCHVLDF